MSESEKARAKRLLDGYKLTIDKWEILFQYQKGLCWICGKVQDGGKRLATDHEHKGLGEVRGLLCRRCNTLLGKIERPGRSGQPWTLDELKRAVLYIENPPAREAWGAPHHGYPHAVSTKTHRRMLRKLKKQAEKERTKSEAISGATETPIRRDS